MAKTKDITTDNKSAEIQFNQIGSQIASLKDFAMLGLIVIFCYLTFSSVKNFEFVNWDDYENFSKNYLITSLNEDNFWENTKQIFKTEVIGNYNPLTIWSFALEKRFYGKGSYNGLDYPGIWHLTNLVLHIICVIIVYIISRKLKLGWLGASLVAALFAIHPMRVESVAWVTERKDVLYGVFFLAAILQYIRYKQSPGIFKLISIYIFFVLSLLSKIQAVTLPLTMIALDFLMDDKFHWKSIARKWPFFLVSLFWGVLGIFLLGKEGSLSTNIDTFPFWQRIFIGTFSYCIYVIKSIIPYEMSPIYPYPAIVKTINPQDISNLNLSSASLPAYFYPTILIIPVIGFLAWHTYRKKWRIFGFSLAFFTFNIMFLLQVLGAGQGFKADRFTYIAYFGIFYAFGYLLESIASYKSSRNLVITISLIACLIYAFICKKQTDVWQNSETLWTHALKHYNKTTVPWTNRADYYTSKKMYEKALSDYNQSIKLKEEPKTLNLRAKLYFDMTNDTFRLNLALRDYNRAIELKKDDGEFWINRGATYARLGQLEKALSDINKGIELKPNHETGYMNRSIVYFSMAVAFISNPQGYEYQKYTKLAIDDLDKYQTFNKYNAESWYKKAKMKRSLSKLNDALKDINMAIELEPSNAEYYYERAIQNFQLRKKEAATSDLSSAINLGYKNVDPVLQSAIQKM